MWVFAYGSLIWDTGFPVAEARPAEVAGWHRSFCMWSVHYRGTPLAPGLVLALDKAGDATCRGVAFRVAPGAEAETLAYLRARELVSSAYAEATVTAMTAAGPLQALTYVIDPSHAQYCGGLPLEDQAQVIARASGLRGPNRDYLFATAAHLADLGLPDPDLDWLAARVRALAG
jgi:glutathione-specific gamma-glutamylcyclotransferase